MPMAQAADVQLSYERAGEGPPLLLIMGMSGTMHHWGEPFLSVLESDFDVIRYDHRGVGDSAMLEGGLTIAQMAQDAAGLLEALELESAHVLGISMGGMVAQELALARPDLVRTLGLGCTYCGGPGSALASPELMQGLAEAMMSGDRVRAIRAGWEANVSAALAADEEAFAEFLANGEAHAVAVPVVMAQAQACMAHDTHERLPSLAMPTLVVHGTEDQMLPVANGRLISSLIDGSQLEILDGIGHMFWWERPERAAELLRAHAAAPSH